jgi:hypothetical protein
MKLSTTLTKWFHFGVFSASIRLLLAGITQFSDIANPISKGSIVNNSKLFRPFLCLLLVTVTTACSPIKKLEVWKDETYSNQPQKILLIVISKRDNIRRQSENVLANQLAEKGVEAIRSYKVLPQEDKSDREAIEAQVRALGVDSVLVARSISQREITNHQYGGVVLGGVAVYSDGGWYGYGYGYSYNREYDSDYFIVSTKLYDVEKHAPVWSSIVQVKVDGSKEKAVNQLIPIIIEELEASELLQ